MAILEAIAVAFSMFSAIPVPQAAWNEKNMRWALCAFPLVGLLTGLLCWGWSALGGYFQVPVLLSGVLFTLIPVLVTGGIHLDGYADTCDALASHAEPERKREILKDPHIGSFAVIRLCGYFLLMTALWCSLPVYRPVPVLLGFCLSRTLSALAVIWFPKAGTKGTAWYFAEKADRKRTGGVLAGLGILITAALLLCGISGVMMAAAAYLVFGYYRYMAKNRFGGLSGDLAGWFLVQAEKWMLIALVAVEYLENRL